MNDVHDSGGMTSATCGNCGATFDLSGQRYFADLCPDCYPGGV